MLSANMGESKDHLFHDPADVQGGTQADQLLSPAEGDEGLTVNGTGNLWRIIKVFWDDVAVLATHSVNIRPFNYTFQNGGFMTRGLYSNKNGKKIENGGVQIIKQMKKT